MSQNRPPRKQREYTHKPDYKIRPGFTDDELAEFHVFLERFDTNPGKFTRKVILENIRKRTIELGKGEVL